MKTCIVIAGPTAVGKTSIAIEVAKYFNTAVISADSRQCYKELSIGVARPSSSELLEVPHYFIASHTVTDNLTAADFEKYALDKASELFKHHDFIVLTGGTGLYIKAFCEGLDDIPPADPELRKMLINGYKENGLDWLKHEVEHHDPLFFKTGEMENPHRIMRALEVVISTGKSIFSFHNKLEKERPFKLLKIGLELPREELYQRINIRVDEMFNAGLVQEVESLKEYRDFQALQTVGYKEVFEFLDGKISLQQAALLIKQNTRHYAKRQLTWFKKDSRIHWVKPAMDEIIKVINNSVKT